MPKDRPNAPVLAADDDRVVRNLIGHYLTKADLRVETFESGDALLGAVSSDTAVVILDVLMPGSTGLECLRQLRKEWPDVSVVMLTSKDEARMAVECLREGAFEYLTKPFDAEDLAKVVKNAMRLSRLDRENRELRDSLTPPVGPATGFVGESESVSRLMRDAQKIAASDNTALITGESGCGKGVYARMLHEASPRRHRPFITVSCPAMPRELLESELFGHEKGAFSGAHTRRLGRVELASGGTLFLDEIGEMPLDLQPKLLNFLQDRNFFRVGGQEQLQADVRVVCATNRDLKQMAEEGEFREDLYYRLNVLPIKIPPLRERPTDVSALIQHFIVKGAERVGMETPKLSADAERMLCRYPWPGNVRQLENVIERVLTFHEPGGPIDREALPEEILVYENDPMSAAGSGSAPGVQIANISLENLERIAIAQTLDACNGVKIEAARRLGITEKSIYNKMRRLGLMEAKPVSS